MPTNETRTLYRYRGPARPRVAPFPGVPARDLTADDVARLPPGALKRITGGDRPLYVAAGRAKAPDPAETPAAKAAKAETPAPAEKEG